MGDNVLVAPMFAGEKTRKVILPQGNWYDFYTGKLVGNGEVITVKPGLDKIPLFVKDGGIIPMISKVHRASAWNNEMPLEVRVYGEKDGTFTLYDDDGKSFDYEKGKFTKTTLTVKEGTGTIDVEGAKDWSYDNVTWTYMSK
jgi:alpha-D-xyloside xylohydrolase